LKCHTRMVKRRKARVKKTTDKRVSNHCCTKCGVVLSEGYTLRWCLGCRDEGRQKNREWYQKKYGKPRTRNYRRRFIEIDSVFQRPAPKDFKPTKALPGSEEKMIVLSTRYEKGFPLWHPLDKTFDDPTEFERKMSARQNKFVQLPLA